MADAGPGRIDPGCDKGEDRLPGLDGHRGEDHRQHPQAGRDDERADKHRAMLPDYYRAAMARPSAV
jgi:hypothetical protein